MNGLMALHNIRLPKIHIKPSTKMYVGMATAAAGTVAACIATMKLNDIIEEHMEKMEEIRENAPEETVGKETVIQYGRTAGRVFKLYLGPVLLLVAGNTMMHSSFIDMKNLNLDLAAGIASIKSEFGNYRGCVRERLGEEEEKVIFDGGHLIDVTEYDENGKKTKYKATVYDGKPCDPWAFLFDESNRHWEKAHMCNPRFVSNQLKYCQAKLDARDKATGGKGWLTLNELREMFDMLPVAGGFTQVFPSRDENGDRFVIDLGLNSKRAQSFMDGEELSVWLTPNCKAINLGEYFPERSLACF